MESGQNVPYSGKQSMSAVVISIVNNKAQHTRTKHGQMTFLTPDKTLTVLEALRERARCDWAMILLAYWHGLGASEVCGLKLTDIDLKAGSISIRRLKRSLATVQPLCPHRGQPLLGEVSALRAWLRERRSDGSDYLFTSQKGGRLDRTQFFRVFQTIAEAASLPFEKRHPHVLKHSLASHLFAGNVNLSLIRQALGHRSINSTMQYAGITASRVIASTSWFRSGQPEFSGRPL
jgi:type 1 fimbriae regulatory protein FimB